MRRIYRPQRHRQRLQPASQIRRPDRSAPPQTPVPASRLGTRLALLSSHARKTNSAAGSTGPACGGPVPARVLERAEGYQVVPFDLFDQINFPGLGLDIVTTEMLVDGAEGTYALRRDYEWHPHWRKPTSTTGWVVYDGGVPTTPINRSEYVYNEFGLPSELVHPGSTTANPTRRFSNCTWQSKAIRS